ncbi:hypothetical protein MYAM1_001427 [Malassezia yamatoensis]|uniref:Tr-type G domain-containing protein n=1 Tax=Malassezia yamatoensis TaxID=253288 RepID=A0AAJ6CGX8_9BASI|nr:hypothetical protein MYAM1_001427 [Malassezia yamatoensis]
MTQASLDCLSAAFQRLDFVTVPKQQQEDHDKFVEEVRQLLERGGGESLIALQEDASAKLPGVAQILCVPYEAHQSCLQHLSAAAAKLNARITCEHSSEKLQRTFLLLRAEPQAIQDHIEVRVAIVGNVDAGKSTLLGVLTKGALDDGRGRARVGLFRHKHELDTGRTSSVGTEVMGFRADGTPVVEFHSQDSAARKVAWETICQEAAKVVSFIDLAGHERYLKTTVYGMTSGLPDYVALMVGANAGLIGMSKEHLGIALALGIPLCVVVTKVDMCPAHILDATLKQIEKVLQSPGCRKSPINIQSKEDVIQAAVQLPVERICPIFQVSNVTGKNLDLLRLFFDLLPSGQARFAPMQSEPAEMPITDIFSVPFVGTVVSGVLTAGTVHVGDSLLLGPDSLGQFVTTSVRSIQRKRVNIETGYAGQSVSFALKRVKRNQVRKGMLLLARTSQAPSAHQEFEAEVLCLYHSTTLSLGSCIVLHAASIRQTVKIMAIAKIESNSKRSQPSETLQSLEDTKPVVRMGDRARLRLRFVAAPEYIQPGTKLIAREGRTRLVGVVRDVGDAMQMNPALNSRDARNLGKNRSSTVPIPHTARLSTTA